MTVPFDYQRIGAKRVHKFGGRALIAAEMGLGKSFMSLLYAQRHPETWPVVVVCPASLKLNWQREVAIHLGMHAEVLEGTKPKEWKLPRHPQLVIVNYDVLKPWIPWLRKQQPGLVIFDESHYLQSRSSLRSRMARQLVRDVPHVVALTGTPITIRPVELWPTLNILRPDLFGNFTEFARKFCDPRFKPWGWEYKGATNLPLLRRTLNDNVMIRYRKADVLSQLPAQQRTVVPLDLSKRKQYDHALKDFLGWLRKHKPGKVSKAAKAERLVQLGYLKRLAAELKLPAAFAWIDDFLAGSGKDKLIVFGIHKKIIAALAARYKGMAVTVTGETAKNKRLSLFDQFNHNPKTRLLIGNIDAAGVGLNAKTDASAFVELPWASGKVTQAEARTHGLGRGIIGRRSRSYFLVAKDTIEMSLCELLQKRQDVITETLDGKGQGEHLDLLDQLVALLQKGKK